MNNVTLNLFQSLFLSVTLNGKIVTLNGKIVTLNVKIVTLNGKIVTLNLFQSLFPRFPCAKRPYSRTACNFSLSRA